MQNDPATTRKIKKQEPQENEDKYEDSVEYVHHKHHKNKKEKKHIMEEATKLHREMQDMERSLPKALKHGHHHHKSH